MIKKFQELGEFRIFSYNYFGNYYFILLVPDVWSFEVIETWFSGAFMNPSQIDIGLGDWEGYNGRTEYASNVTGGYYAARLAATEYLLKIQRQAQIIVFRETALDVEHRRRVIGFFQHCRIAVIFNVDYPDTELFSKVKLIFYVKFIPA